MKKIFFLMLFSGVLLSSLANGIYNHSINIRDKNDKQQPPGRRAEVLFLGHKDTHHNSGKFAPMLSIPLFARGINITYTTDTNDLNAANLNKYDGLIIYANYDKISPAKEKVIKDFVEGGKGLIPIHSASASFVNSSWYIQAIGGQFKSHKTGHFTAVNVNKTHPVMEGINEFETWDETYVHSNINPDKTVLQERVENGVKEPWTWVRNQGKGRVFYTAYGHNDSTWTNPMFQKLIGNGVLWAIGDKVQAEIAAFKTPKVLYNDTIIVPNYEKRDPAPKFQYALTPEESMDLMQVPVDFEVKLFAAEPDITNPIAMSWDERGRLWIVESVDYPNTFVETDGAANDRIKILEDTDGDGRADKFTIFADSLNIPSSIVFANGGVIISMAPHMVFLKDTDGDDKADLRQEFMEGWGKNDTHAGPSNLRYGFDNKIWGVVGYSGFNNTIDNKSFRFAQGVYRFNPDGTDFEFLANSNNNTWGLGFTEDNNVFVSTANGNHSDYYSMPYQLMQRPFPERIVQASDTQNSNGRPGGRNVAQQVIPLSIIQGHGDMHTLTPNLRQVDVHGGFTAAAGHDFYTARNFPKEYWNRIAFVNEPTGRLTHNAIIERSGAGYKEVDGWNLLASSDEWVGPVQATVGPDGAVWVADWYNFIIQHNPTPGPTVSEGKQFINGQGNAFITPMRDLDRGRIYRIVYKDAKPYTPISLSKDNTAGLLGALESDNLFWRLTAQRLLVENNNKAAIPGLIKLINDKKVDEIGLNGPAINALWTLEGLKVLDGSNSEASQAVVGALSHPSAGVRKAALEVLPKNEQTFALIQKAGLLKDPDLNTRMNAFVVVAQLPTSVEAGKALYTASLDAENAKDEWISKALYAAAIRHQDGFMSSVPAGFKTSGTTELTLTQRVVQGLSNEIYSLARRQGSVGAVAFSPDVVGKEIIIKAAIGRASQQDGRPNGPGGQQVAIDPNAPIQGFIAGQGGRENGYGVFIQDGKLNMIVRQDGKSYVAVSNAALPEKYELVAKLLAGGEMSIEVDGKQVAKGKAPALFTKTLDLNLRSSQDLQEPTNDKIGDYEGTFRFTGSMEDATIELRKPGTAKTVVAETAKPVNAPAQDVTVLQIDVVPNAMAFSKKLVTVKAGQKVRIRIANPDQMQHNLIIIKPGTLNKVGAAADEMALNANAASLSYVPRIPEVLHATKLLDPDESTVLEFTAPSQVGDYPFVCTFPGHWRMMQGVMKVVK
ncbi:PVC-type heme-binding CxxCH protein [Albibacterium bauzanense]|uniref:Putative membrane-bound dehydrogenase-like protein n=1 Tax=Albibacterium bauzanense TaxID=653929 RepID=A0A4R1LUV3_9SPHI|nr:PVC-type heme-binding CxxCH protein [Albibacterium bauzanense]TCK82632.1 putative membrane-bound dehydrogenase-like protein [Albibacterium bauzanense]